MTYEEAITKLKSRYYKGELGAKVYYKLRAKLLQKRFYPPTRPIDEKITATPDLDSPYSEFDGRLPVI